MFDRDIRQSTRRAGWPLAIAAVGIFLWVGAAAAPARADSTFERGFEDQMGRILAYEAVNLGKNILFQGIVHPARHGGYGGHGAHPGHGYDYRPSHGYPPGYAYGHGYGKGHKKHKHYVHHPRRHVPHYTHEYGPRPYHKPAHSWRRPHRPHRGHHDGCDHY